MVAHHIRCTPPSGGVTTNIFDAHVRSSPPPSPVSSPLPSVSPSVSPPLSAPFPVSTNSTSSAILCPYRVLVTVLAALSGSSLLPPPPLPAPRSRPLRCRCRSLSHRSASSTALCAFVASLLPPSVRRRRCLLPPPAAPLGPRLSLIALPPLPPPSCTPFWWPLTPSTPLPRYIAASDLAAALCLLAAALPSPSPSASSSPSLHRRHRCLCPRHCHTCLAAAYALATATCAFTAAACVMVAVCPLAAAAACVVVAAVVYTSPLCVAFAPSAALCVVIVVAAATASPPSPLRRRRCRRLLPQVATALSPRPRSLPLRHGRFLCVVATALSPPLSNINVFIARRASGGPLVKPLLYLLPFPMSVLLHVAWLNHPTLRNSDIINSPAFAPFLCAWGLQFAHVVGQMILAHFTSQPFSLWDLMYIWTIVGTIDANMPILFGRPPLIQHNPENTEKFVFVVLAVAFVTYARFVVLVISDITDYLGIACLTNRLYRDGLSTPEALNAELGQQTEPFNRLRIDNSDPAALEESRRRLGEIKRELAALKPGGKGAKKQERLLLKTRKGTRNYGPGEMLEAAL
ncbi:hypothetical protein EDB83DRAFT_2632547 [Lactarius deliciosus]|nr:hypothetical protein EDB83DRAFT_2632547 [Lactarius deliciosus]